MPWADVYKRQALRDADGLSVLRRTGGASGGRGGAALREPGVSGLMVFARTPAAAAALSRQITQSQEAYAVQDGRAEGRAEAPCFVKQLSLIHI